MKNQMLYDHEVSFKDPAIEMTVRRTIKNYHDPILFSQVIHVKELEVIGRGVRDLDGVQNLINLRKLSLYNNNLRASTLRHISELENLEVLDLGENKDLFEVPSGILSNLVNLRELILDETGIYSLDVEDMKCLSKLEDVLLEDNNLKNLNFLKYNTNLKKVLFRNNNVSDISGLENLDSLVEVWGGMNVISDISALKNKKELVYLNLERNFISDISSLEDSTKLTHLYLGNNRVQSIDALGGMNSLVNLELEHNSIYDIRSISAFDSLERLYLFNNHIKDFSHLKNFNSLQALYVRNNDSKNYEPLEVLKAGLSNKDF